jgi:gentisate 1,2-dioxygenase
VLYQVAQGGGWSVVDRKRFDWEEKDVFCVPSWSPHADGTASSDEDAVLFSFIDFPAMRALAPYREAEIRSA